jgi:formylglycine-generating enzyme required for sulfatase activity
MSIVLAACSPASGSPSAQPTSVPVLGDTRTDPFGIEQVWVPAGSFTMGSDDAAIGALATADPSPPPWVAAEFASEQPAHEVRLTEGYWIDRDEVTNAAFDAFVGAGGYTTQAYWSPEGWAWVGDRDVRGLPKRCPDDGPDIPRRCITWFEAEAYAAWRGGALPTEAQWEFAARGPDARVYPWGDAWDPTRANVVDSTGAVAVGSHPGGVSWVGANDMAGNAMEWVADWLGPYGTAEPVDDPTGPASGEVKVEKGGWWGSNPFVARSAYRHYEDPPTYGDKHIGFRIVSD